MPATVDPTTDDLQPIYDEMNRRGFFTSDPDLQAIGHELRLRKIIVDPTQGGLVHPQAVTQTPSPVTPPAPQDLTPIPDTPVNSDGSGTPGPSMYDSAGAMVGRAFQAPPAQAGGVASALGQYAGQQFVPPTLPPAYLASAQNPHDAATEGYAQKFLRPAPDDKDPGAPADLLEKVAGLPLDQRQVAVAKSGFSPTGQLAVLREAYRVAPQGPYRSLSSIAQDAGVATGIGTTPQGKTGVVPVGQDDLNAFRMQYFNTANPKANMPMMVADALAKDPANKNAIAKLYQMKPAAQAAIIQKSAELAQQNQMKLLQPSGFSGQGGGVGNVPQLQNQATGAISPLPSTTETIANVLHGPEGARQMMMDQGIGATIEKTGLGFLEPQNLALLGGAGAVSAASKTAARFISFAFAADMTKSSAEAFGAGNTAQGTVSAIMAGLAGLHAAKTPGIGPVSKAEAAQALNLLQQIEQNYPAAHLDEPALTRNIGILRTAQAVAARIADTGESPDSAMKFVVNDSRSGPAMANASPDVIRGVDRRAVNQPVAPPASTLQGHGTPIGESSSAPVILGPDGKPYRETMTPVPPASLGTGVAPLPPESQGAAAPPDYSAPNNAPVSASAPVEINTDMFGQELRTPAALQAAANDYNKMMPGINARVERVGKRNVLMMDQHPADYVDMSRATAPYTERVPEPVGSPRAASPITEPPVQENRGYVQENPDSFTRPVEPVKESPESMHVEAPVSVETPATQGMSRSQRAAANRYFSSADQHFGANMPEGGHLKVLSDLLQRPVASLSDVTPEEFRAAAKLVPWHNTIEELQKQRETRKNQDNMGAEPGADEYGYGEKIRKMASDVLQSPEEHLQFKEEEAKANRQTFDIVGDLRKATLATQPTKGYNPWGKKFSTGEPVTRGSARQYLLNFYGKDVPANQVWDRYFDMSGEIHAQNIDAQIATLREILKRRPPEEPPPAPAAPPPGPPPAAPPVATGAPEPPKKPALQKSHTDIARASMFAALNEKGLANLPRDERLRGLSQIVGRRVNSTTELMSGEASHAARVIRDGGWPKPDAAKEGHVVGREGTTYTPDNNPVGFHYAVVEGKDLIASHTSIMRENPRYDQSLQPRDRTRRASAEQVLEISKTLNPDRLGGDSSTTAGAPLIGPDNQVESGNGRTLGILKAYEREPRIAQKYQQWIVEHAEEYGLDPGQIGAMKEPVLVRVRDRFKGKADLSPAERAAFAEEAGKSVVAEMSPEEKAFTDGKRIRQSGLLKMFRPNEEGSVQTSANQPFVNRFISDLSPAERGSMRQADGSLSEPGARRIQNAVTAAAFDDPEALRRLLGDPDPEAKNVGRAMQQSAARLALLKESMVHGDVPNVDITGDIIRAANRYAGLRERGESIPDYIAQKNLFVDDPVEAALIKWFYENKRSSPAVRELFDAYADVVGGKLRDHTPTKLETLQEAIGVAEARLGRDTQTADLFGETPHPEGAEVPGRSDGGQVAEGQRDYRGGAPEAAGADQIRE